MIHLICSIDSCTAIVVTCHHLTKLVRNLTVSQSDLSFFVRIVLQTATIHPVCVLTSRLHSSPVRKQCLIYFKKRFFVINEQIQQIALVSHCEIGQFDPVLRELSESQKRFLEFTSLFGVLFDLLKLLFVVDFVL